MPLSVRYRAPAATSLELVEIEYPAGAWRGAFRGLRVLIEAGDQEAAWRPRDLELIDCIEQSDAGPLEPGQISKDPPVQARIEGLLERSCALAHGGRAIDLTVVQLAKAPRLRRRRSSQHLRVGLAFGSMVPNPLRADSLPS